MGSVANRELPSFTAQALDAAKIGVWESDASQDHFRFDPFMASLFGLSAADSQSPVLVSSVVEAVHPDDRAGWQNLRQRLVHHGGHFVMEFRVCSTGQTPKWLLTRGNFCPDESGRMVGRGISIDVTRSRNDSYVEGRAFNDGSDQKSDYLGSPLDRAASHAIAARLAIDEYDGPTHSRLRASVDDLLLRLGQAISMQLTGSFG